MTEHKLRSWSHLYDAIARGEKKHDLRRNDRKFQVGDVLVLQRFDNCTGEYTGRECSVRVTYVTGRDHVPCAVSSAVLDNEYCILSIELVA